MGKVGGPLVLLRDTNTAGRQQIHAKYASGELVRVRRGVYLPTQKHRRLTRRQREKLHIVATALTRPRCILTGKSAALIHGLATPSYTSNGITVEIGNATSTGRTERGCKYRNVPNDHESRAQTVQTEFGEVRASSLIDTCAEMALWHSTQAAVTAIESAFQRRPLHVGEWEKMVELIIERVAGRKGAAQARQALKLVTPFSESPRESELKVALWRAGFPVPYQQVNIYARTGELLGRVDFMFECGLVVEYDGRVKYDNSLGTPLDHVLLNERNREKALQNEGFVVLRVDADSFWDQTYLAQIHNMLKHMQNAGFSAPKAQWRAAGRSWKE